MILESIDEMAVEIDAILEKLGNIQIATELFWAALLIRKDFVIDRLAEIEANVGVSEKNWTPPKFLANTQCYVCQNELGENKVKTQKIANLKFARENPQLEVVRFLHNGSLALSTSD